MRCSRTRRIVGAVAYDGSRMVGVPTGIRTRVSALKGPRPRPLDDGDVRCWCRIQSIEMLQTPSAESALDNQESTPNRTSKIHNHRRSGGPPGDRTRDTLIKSQVLYH